MKYWDKLRTPPKTALKTIGGGRLKDMTDINPQWRLQAMTETFGTVGLGWCYTIDDHWERQHESQVAVFVKVSVYIKDGEVWSKPIQGTGGSMLVSKEKAGLYFSDEAYKMDTTDALSVAFKALGVGADIYLGMSDSKYAQAEDEIITDLKVKINAKLKNLDMREQENRLSELKFVATKDNAVKISEYKRILSELDVIDIGALK